MTSLKRPSLFRERDLPYTLALLAALAVGCSAGAQLASPQAGQAAPEAEPAASSPSSPPAEPAPIASAAFEPAAPSAAPALGPAAEAPSPSADPRLHLEPPHAPGAFPWPSGAGERKAMISEIARWNEGGLGEGARWHPAPRVVIGEPSIGRGKADAKALMRALRAEHYWTARRCYEPELRASPLLEGRTVVRLSLGRDGAVRSARASAGGKGVADSRKHGKAMPSRAVRDCLARSLRGARLPAPRSAADITFSVDLYPGDAPLPEPEGPPSPGRVDLAEARRALEGRAAGVQRCLEEASARKPGLWGRLALRLSLDAQGRVARAAEVESTFPDPQAAACAARALEGAKLGSPSPSGAETAVIAPLRWMPRGEAARPPSDEGEP